MTALTQPVLVLLPGMDGTGLMFEPFVRALHGLEPLVVRYPAELTSYADCIDYARAQLPLDRPFLLLGESFSGPVAIALAAEHPRHLAGLVLCVTFAKNPRPRLARWAAPLLRALPPMRLPMPLLRRLLLGRRAPASLIRLVELMLPQVPTATLKRRLLAVVEVDHTALLAQIQVPALALCASHDRLVPAAASDWMKTHLPSLEVHMIQGPHWLLQTRPDEAMRVLQGFLESKGLSGF